MLVYVAGPYSPNPKLTYKSKLREKEQVTKNILAAEQVAAKLWKMGHAVICPHLNTAHFDTKYPEISSRIYLKGDLEMLARCDALVLCTNDYQDSVGTLGELAYAKHMGIPIYEFDDELPQKHALEIQRPVECQVLIESLMTTFRIHTSKEF